MKRVLRLSAVAGTALGLVLSTVAGSSAAPSPAATTTASQVYASTSATVAGATFNPRARFARESVSRGAADTSVHNIEHVRELQYRLRWVGAYRGWITGRFNRSSVEAVKRFQKRNDLRVTGAANSQTWAKLIPKSVRDKGKIPGRCKRRNVRWHACYDRTNHQVTLWRENRLWNAWLVRGGGRGQETRLGTNTVFKRDRDHVSGLYGSPMPHSQFFDGGQALHGSAMMTDPFDGHSAGCINMYQEDARQLWKLTARTPMRQTKVTVYGAWS
jgi:hypothetical protein